MIRPIPLILAAFVLAGCESQVQQARMDTQNYRMDANLAPWIGRPVSAYAMERGAPQASFASGPGQRAFQWQWHRPGPVVAMPVGNMAVATSGRTQTCMVSFVADGGDAAGPDLSGWIIRSYSWNGAC